MSVHKMTQAEWDAVPWLHVFGQDGEHDEVLIYGTVSALTGLRDAIDRALKAGPMQRQSSEGVVSDGEGFTVETFLVSAEDIKKLRTPYARSTWGKE